MLDELDETLRRLLVAEMPIRGSEIEVTFEQPNRANAVKWKKPAINFFLYDLRENSVLRNQQIERQPEANGNTARLKRPPLRVDCYYMLTTWANDPETEHRLLSRCLLTLFRFPVLSAERLSGSLKDQPYPLQVMLASHDKLTNPAEAWASLDNELRPSVSYIVTLALDPWEVDEVPTTRTVVLRPGQAAAPEKTQALLANAREADRHLIGGVVREGGASGRPLEGVRVSIEGSAEFAITDQQGRYSLGGLPAGRYVFVAARKQGAPAKKEITIPASQGDYDLTLS